MTTGWKLVGVGAGALLLWWLAKRKAAEKQAAYAAAMSQAAHAAELARNAAMAQAANQAASQVVVAQTASQAAQAAAAAKAAYDMSKIAQPSAEQTRLDRSSVIRRTPYKGLGILGGRS